MVLSQCNELITTIIKDRNARLHLENAIYEECATTIRWQLLYGAEKRREVLMCVGAQTASPLIVSYLTLLHNWQLVN